MDKDTVKKFIGTQLPASHICNNRRLTNECLLWSQICIEPSWQAAASQRPSRLYVHVVGKVLRPPTLRVFMMPLCFLPCWAKSHKRTELSTENRRSLRTHKHHDEIDDSSLRPRCHVRAMLHIWKAVVSWMLQFQLTTNVNGEIYPSIEHVINSALFFGCQHPLFNIPTWP